MNPVCQSNFRRSLSEYVGLLFVLLILVVFFGTLTDHFFSTTTLRTVANQTPESILIAVGMTFVLVVAGIDLSVGSLLGLSGAVLGYCLTRLLMPLPVAILACVAVGALGGLMNGFVIVRWSLPSFIATLGMLEAARGAAYLVSGSKTAYIGPQIERLAEINLAGISLPFMLAIAIAATGQVVLTRTVFGRYMTAIGTNEEAVRLSGINPRPIKMVVFVVSGVLASIASICNVARLGAADPNAGIGAELNAIAAVVIGGTSLMGGHGSVINSVLGVMIIAVLENGLAQMGAQEPVKRLVTGGVIVAAVILDRYRVKRS